MQALKPISNVKFILFDLIQSDSDDDIIVACNLFGTVTVSNFDYVHPNIVL